MLIFYSRNYAYYRPWTLPLARSAPQSIGRTYLLCATEPTPARRSQSIRPRLKSQHRRQNAAGGLCQQSLTSKMREHRSPRVGIEAFSIRAGLRLGDEQRLPIRPAIARLVVNRPSHERSRWSGCPRLSKCQTVPIPGCATTIPPASSMPTRPDRCHRRAERTARPWSASRRSNGSLQILFRAGNRDIEAVSSTFITRPLGLGIESSTRSESTGRREPIYPSRGIVQTRLDPDR